MLIIGCLVSEMVFSKITALCENIYELYSSNTENALNHFLNRLRFKEIVLTKEEQKIFNAKFEIDI